MLVPERASKAKTKAMHLICVIDKSYVSIPIKIKYTLGKAQHLFFTLWN